MTKDTSWLRGFLAQAAETYERTSTGPGWKYDVIVVLAVLAFLVALRVFL